MTAGQNKTILPICKPATREMIQKGKHTRIHHFMHGIMLIERDRIVGNVDHGLTCLALQTGQSLALEGLEDCPMLVRLINDIRK
jgi:hypothetical protein